VEAAAADGVTFSVPVTPIRSVTLRDAYAVRRHTSEGFAEPDGHNRSVPRRSIRRCLVLMSRHGTGCSLLCRKLKLLC
jgi:hypothetical protein